MLPVPLRTASKFCYGILRTVTFCCVHPVLLRPTTFLIRTVTAVAKFLTVEKSGPASTAITACHGSPSRPPTLSHVPSRPSRFVHGGLKRDCRGRREHSVNVAILSFAADSSGALKCFFCLLCSPYRHNNEMLTIL